MCVFRLYTSSCLQLDCCFVKLHMCNIVLAEPEEAHSDLTCCVLVSKALNLDFQWGLMSVIFTSLS